MHPATELIGCTSLPRHEAERLLVVATGWSRTDVLLADAIPQGAIERYRALVGRREAGEPLQYLEGDVPFGPAMIAVDPRVLIPRPETEEMLELALQMAPAPHIVVDLCTGSGNLAIALAMMRPDARVVATDISQDAAAAASDNAAVNGVAVEILVGDLFAPLPDEIRGQVDLLVANPPYLAARELEDVPADVAHEPPSALVAGPVGDEVLERIGASAADWLAPGGLVVCEISEFGSHAVVRHFESVGGRIHHDLSGKDRFVVGRRPVE